MSVSSENICDMLLEIEKQQCNQLSSIKYGESVCYIYNPLDYAKETHEFYVRNYCTSTKIVLFLGMNPGPFGMAQNGVPFGDSFYVNNWLKISGSVSKPSKEHPKRLIQGLNCSRPEVSGSRFWSFLEEICVKPDKFFRNCYVHNYCPFSMMTASAKNITPSDLKASNKKALINICDESLHKVISLLKVNVIVGIGKFAEGRAAEVVKSNSIPNVTVVGIMHPSPINPAANKGWKDIAYKQLEKYGILGYLV